jgi:hypothetical protein
VISTVFVVLPFGGVAVGVFTVTVPPNEAVSHQLSAISSGKVKGTSLPEPTADRITRKRVPG